MITHGFHLLQIQSLCFFPLQELPSLRRDVLGQQTKDGTWSESTGNNSALWRAWAHLACVCLWPYSIDAAVFFSLVYEEMVAWRLIYEGVRLFSSSGLDSAAKLMMLFDHNTNGRGQRCVSDSALFA